MSDIFADLLKNEKGSSKPENSMSLNERLNASRSSTPQNQNGLDLDFLDRYMNDSKQRQATNSGSCNGGSAGVQMKEDNDDDLFGLGSMKPLVSQSIPQQTAPTSKSVCPEVDLFEDFFGQTVKSDAPMPKEQSKKMSDTPRETPHASPSQQSLRDSALAELVDMGFSLERANAALDSTNSGHDLDSAINYLMNEANNKNRATDWSNSRQPNDDIGDIVNDLSSQLMSTASFLFNSGKKKLQEGVEMYRKQKIQSNGGKPLWMKNQEQYRSDPRTATIGFEDGFEDDFDDEVIRKLVNKQREGEQKLKSQRETNKVSRENTLAASSFTQDSDIYVSSSRHRRNKIPTSTQTSTSTPPLEVKSKQTAPVSDTPSLIDTSTAPQSAFETSPLNSAQSMEYMHAKKKAQEMFKAGDYTSALEYYNSGSNVIPLDHPYQIILHSNIALTYSKLGNPKDQLASTDRGLELIKKLTNGSSVSSLAQFNIENTNLRKLWIKLMVKRAESLENLEKWSEAKLVYETLIGHGEGSKPVMDGKNRCNKVLNPVRSRPKPIVPKNSKHTAKDNEKLKRVQDMNKQKVQEDEQKFKLHDHIEEQLNSWRAGNKDNIRALICSLDKILWPELNWKPVQLTDLVMDKKVKIFYMKAVAKTHPDKVPSTETIEHKMIANGVFITLNEAWEIFKAEKGM